MVKIGKLRANESDKELFTNLEGQFKFRSFIEIPLGHEFIQHYS